MDEDSKRHFDALSILWKGRWENFNQRRIYEWRFSIATWTAFSVFLAKYIFGRPHSIDNSVATGACWIGGIITLAHIVWLYGIGLKNNNDKKVLWTYENRMRDILNEIRLLANETRNPTTTAGPLLNIHHGPQVAITLILYTATILIVKQSFELAIICATAVALVAEMLAHSIASFWPELLT